MCLGECVKCQLTEEKENRFEARVKSRYELMENFVLANLFIDIIFRNDYGIKTLIWDTIELKVGNPVNKCYI